jgi:nicotinamide-nucleotide adenylyltransferase
MAGNQQALIDRFYDITRLGQYAAMLTPGARAAPALTIVRPARGPRPAGRVGFLTGSFNPPTEAHLAIIAAAHKQAALDEIFFATSRIIVDKEGVTRAIMEDRLLLLDLLAAEQPDCGVLLFSGGLYYEQALELRAGAAEGTRIFCIIGYDKLVQIFDPRYYRDRDAALRQLFSTVTLLVAPRQRWTGDDVAALLADPANRPFRDYVQPLVLSPAYREHSSTQVRAAVAAGQQPIGVPAIVAAFIQETAVYAPPRQLASGETVDIYSLRVALLRLLLRLQQWNHGQESAPTGIFRTLFQLAIADDLHGQQLRRWLGKEADRATPEEALTFLKQFESQGNLRHYA